METENNIPQTEHNNKYSGGWHFFVFFGAMVLVLVALKFAIYYLMK